MTCTPLSHSFPDATGADRPMVDGLPRRRWAQSKTASLNSCSLLLNGLCTFSQDLMQTHQTKGVRGHQACWGRLTPRLDMETEKKMLKPTRKES